MSPPHFLGAPAIAENLLKRKWSMTILRHLKNDTNDPVEIIRQEVDLSPSAMSERLRTMVRYNLIVRYLRPGRPKAVEYRLTPKGRRLLTILELINQLDRYPDHDPRSLEQILREEFIGDSHPPVILSAPDPKNVLPPKSKILIA